MKKTILMMTMMTMMTMMVGSVQASTAPLWMGGVSLDTQISVTPDHGNTSIGGVLSWHGVGLGLYAGGHHDSDRRSGYGADLHLELDQLMGGSLWVGGGNFVGLYGDAGIYVQRGDTTSAATAMTLPWRSKSKSELAGGGGIIFRSRISGGGTQIGKYIEGYRLGLGYHSARGITTSVGIYW
jgi:hypothetical protein